MLHSIRSRRKLCCLSLLVGIGVVSFSSAAALAATISVPSQKPTIQAGIDAALAGDTVMVASGTYTGAGNYNIDLKGKSITLKSSGGAQTCIINAGGANSVFLLQGNEPATASIDGFTITGGNALKGGGVYFKNSSATVRNCIITANSATGTGGGVYSESAGTPRLFNCTIKNNIAASQGGGVCVVGSDLRIENCAFKGNSAVAGGAVATVSGAPLVVNCLITNNTGTTSGGGVYLLAGKMANCTISANSSPSGSAVFGSAAAPIANSILWNNTGSAQVANTPEITYSTIQGSYPGVGNRSTDPKFMNAAGDDYRLGYKSPSCDAGSRPKVPSGITKDLAGMNRFIEDRTCPDVGEGPPPMVDMGAYEKTILGKKPGLHDLPGPPG